MRLQISNTSILAEEPEESSLFLENSKFLIGPASRLALLAEK
jgi:hypothetical protein